MSVVTNLLLSFSVMEEGLDGWDRDGYALMTPINAWLTAHGYGAFGQDADQVSGGTKHLEVPLYVAAFNSFQLDEFLAMLRTLPWIEPACVQVFVQEEDEDTFRVMKPLVEH